MSNDTPEEHTCPECGYKFEDDTTTLSSKERWEYTGTVVAIASLLSLPTVIILAGVGIFLIGNITQGWLILYSTVVLMAATWTFGKETLQAVREVQGKD